MSFQLFLILCLIFIANFVHPTFAFQKPITSGLFVHTDKTIYYDNETIWFSAYLFVGSLEQQKKHNILNVIIASGEDGKVLLEQKYAINQGICSGMLMLPDSIKAGKYQFIAFTNVLNSQFKPISKFVGTINLGIVKNQAEHIITSNIEKEGITELSYLRTLIATDKYIYNKREPVKIKLKLEDGNKQALQFLFSIAAVHRTRLNNNQKKITRDALFSKYEDSLSFPQSLSMVIKYRKKNPDKEIIVAFFGDKNMKILKSDNRGQLKIDRESMLVPYGKKVAAIVSGTNAEDYSIILDDPFLKIGDSLARENIIDPEVLVVDDEDELPHSPVKEKAVDLNTVVIKANSSRSASYKGRPGVNDCGDWVDEYDYLNYPYSEKRYQPIIGKQYKRRIDLNGQRSQFKVEPVYYTGCQTITKKTATLIKGINVESPFYGVDLSTNNLQYLTTLYWGAGLLSNENGELELTFNAADLSGEYKVVLQGITTGQTTYGECTFQVRE